MSSLRSMCHRQTMAKDFFTSEHWDRLLPSWRDFLHDKEPPDLAFLLDKEQCSREIPPLSLLALQKCISTVSLQRREVHGVSGGIFHATGCHGDTEDQISDDREETSAKENIKDGQYLLLNSCFRKHVKPKKQHEILKLSHVIKLLSDHCDCQNVVDIGAGQGHLSRLLALGYGFKVTTVEAVDCHAPKAQKFDRDAQVDINRSQRKRKQHNMTSSDTQVLSKPTASGISSAVLPEHVTCLIEPDTTVEKFLTIVQDSLKRVPAHHGDEVSDRALKKQATVGDMNHHHNAVEEKCTDALQPPESGKCSGGSYIDCKCHTSGDSDSCSVRKPTESGKCSDGSYTDCKCHTSGDSDSCSVRKPAESGKCSGGPNIDCKCHKSRHSDTCSVKKFILTGLHACGDLTPTMLRVFARCSDISALASVACCYMKLTTDVDNSSCAGYPMSDYLRRMSESFLSYEAREMACHFVDSYRDRLRDNPPNLKLHCYRAALQFIIKKKSPDFSHGCIKLTVRNAEKLSFEEYAKMGLKRLGIEEDIDASLLHQAEKYLPSWKNVVAFYTLRLCLAPVVETLLLLDRMMFLYEKGFRSSLIPIFDPKLSPRNFVLIATRD